ncbi:MAG: branched-chain amino acid transport system permease protein [Clostridiales bacterium]|nr:branched-chain amino acid transport system permease protein [Clostridiales bacterium]
MAVLLQQLLNGISLGSIYALLALGYTMVYGIINLINFAHGDVYMIGAYIGFIATALLGLGFIPALLLSMAISALLGMAIEKVAYRPLRNSSRIALLITAIGMSLLLEYTTMYIAGPDTRSFPTVLTNRQYSFMSGQVNISSMQLYILVISIMLMILLQFIVQRTKIGKAMRAVSMDKDAAQLMGINVDNTISATFAIGSALAGAAGILVGIYYNSIDPLMGITPGLKAFIAAVFGGIGSIPGAMVGGLLLGMIETLVSGYLNSNYRDAVAFVILIIILLIKPSGLLGKNTGEKV